jgi:hypothetical protein
MTIKQLKQEIKGVFKPPIKKYYLGKLHYGTPYFWPLNFNKNILHIRKLIERSAQELLEYAEKYPYVRNVPLFKNLPMVQRSKHWIVKIFDTYYYIEIGWPIRVYSNGLGWKDKFNSPRFEWCPAFYIFFFHWQFVIHWNAPDGDNDKYYEMILKYLHYSDKDIKKTEEEWGWINTDTKQSTWNKNYLINKTI